MQTELLKKPIKSYRTIDIRETEEMLENNIIVPDSKPDVKSILLVDAECFVSNIEKSGRMVEVSGEIRYKILYCSDTPEMKPECIVSRYPWSFSIQKPKTECEMGVFIKCRCQHSEANAINGRKIVARSVVSMISRFYEVKIDEIGREILGENIYLKSSPVNTVTLKDMGDITAKVSNILSLPHGSPAIKEILFSKVNISHAEVSFKDEEPCLESKGTLQILYRSDSMEESIESVVLEFPIKTAAGVQAGADAIILTTHVLKSWEIDAIEDNDGLYTQVSINLELEIDTQAIVYEQQTVIDDAYSIDFNLTLNKTNMSVVTDEREFCESHEIKQKVKIELPEGHVEEILMVCANERNISANISERSISVHGNVGVDVLFCSNSRMVHSHCFEVPFTQDFILPDNGQWQIVQSCFHIEDVGFDISGSETIEVCLKLKVKLRAAKTDEIVCTDAINMVKEETENKASIILYFSQPNDTLWSIAKNYRIPVSRLAADNSLDSNARPEIGKKLFIMK